MNEQLLTSKQDMNSCSYLARQAGEPLFATAPQNQVWFLLEVPPPWGSQAFKESALPEPVKQSLASLLEIIPSSRLQFIYQGMANSSKQISFFVGSSGETGPSLLEFPLHSYEEILSLEITAILDGNPPRHETIRHDSLFLVCTNGRRDPCCSRLGLPVYRRLRKLEPRKTWQTIHVGGHRFAANLVWLPFGLYFGRITESDVQPLMDACDNDQVYLPNYRGRSSYTPPAQAADHYLRLHTGETGVDAYSMTTCEKTGVNLWRVAMNDRISGEEFVLEIGEHTSPFATIQSCRDTQPSPVTLFSIESFEHLSKI